MVGDARLAASDGEHRFDLLGENPFTAHARAESSVIQLAAADGANTIEHLLFSGGKMPSQPLLEQRRHRVGQTKDDVAGELRAGLDRGGDDRWDFMVG